MRSCTTGKISEACSVEPPDLCQSFPAMRGEVWGSRGLALACMGRLEEAELFARTNLPGPRWQSSRQCWGFASRRFAALKARRPDTRRHPPASCGWVVCSRSRRFRHHDLPGEPGSARCTSALRGDCGGDGYIVAARQRGELAESLGLDTLSVHDPVSTLSVREREVYDLLCEASETLKLRARLFISPATAKVHVRHVYDKLGIRLANGYRAKRGESVALTPPRPLPQATPPHPAPTADPDGSPLAGQFCTPVACRENCLKRRDNRSCRTGFRRPERVGAVATLGGIPSRYGRSEVMAL